MAKDYTKIAGSKPNVNDNKPGNAPVAETELHKELGAIRDRDALQQGMLNFVEFLEANKGIVVALIAALFLGAVGYVGWGMMGERRERSAQEAFYVVEKPFTDKREKFEQAKFAGMQGGKVDELIKSGAAVRASGDLLKDFGPMVDNLEAFAKSHQGTTAGVQAALMAAETRIQYKQAEQSFPALEASVKATKAGTLVGGLARIAAGNAQAASGKCDQALKFWEEVLAAKDIPFLHSEAALRAGLCLEKSGDKTKAIEMYRKASSDSEKSTSAQTARTLLRALELGT